MPAPVKHGLRRRLPVSQAPTECNFINKNVRRFRKVVEAEFLRENEAIDIRSEGLIQSAAKHELASQYYMHLLRQSEKGEGDSLKSADRVRLMEAIRACTKDRDVCLEKLGLGRGDQGDKFLAEYDAAIVENRVDGDGREGGEGGAGSSQAQGDAAPGDPQA